MKTAQKSYLEETGTYTSTRGNVHCHIIELNNFHFAFDELINRIAPEDYVEPEDLFLLVMDMKKDISVIAPYPKKDVDLWWILHWLTTTSISVATLPKGNVVNGVDTSKGVFVFLKRPLASIQPYKKA